MSKINKTIVAIKQVLQAGAILPESGKATTKRATKYLLRLFSNLTDCRMPGMICYPYKLHHSNHISRYSRRSRHMAGNS